MGMAGAASVETAFVAGGSGGGGGAATWAVPCPVCCAPTMVKIWSTYCVLGACASVRPVMLSTSSWFRANAPPKRALEACGRVSAPEIGSGESPRIAEAGPAERSIAYVPVSKPGRPRRLAKSLQCRHECLPLRSRVGAAVHPRLASDGPSLASLVAAPPRDAPPSAAVGNPFRGAYPLLSARGGLPGPGRAGMVLSAARTLARGRGSPGGPGWRRLAGRGLAPGVGASRGQHVPLSARRRVVPRTPLARPGQRRLAGTVAAGRPI